MNLNSHTGDIACPTSGVPGTFTSRCRPRIPLSTINIKMLPTPNEGKKTLRCPPEEKKNQKKCCLEWKPPHPTPKPPSASHSVLPMPLCQRSDLRKTTRKDRCTSFWCMLWSIPAFLEPLTTSHALLKQGTSQKTSSEIYDCAFDAK